MNKPWTLLMESPDGKKVDFEVSASSLEEVRFIAKTMTKGVYGRYLNAQPKN
jgi:hypothetical protein